MKRKDQQYSLDKLNNKQDLKDHILNFYYEEFYNLIHGFQRNYLLSKILLTIYFLQTISLSFGPAFLTEYSSKSNAITGLDKDDLFTNHQNGIQSIEGSINKINSDITAFYYIYKLFYYSRIYPIIFDIFTNHEEILKIVIILILLIINISMLLYPVIKIIMSVNNTDQNQFKVGYGQQIKISNSNNNEELSDTLLYQLGRLITMLYQIFRYSLMIPNFVISMQEITHTDCSLFIQIIAIINMVLSILITIIIALHDFDFSYAVAQDNYTESDYLSRRISVQSILNVIGDCLKCGIFCFTTSLSQYYVICFISLFFTAIEYAEFNLSFVFLRNIIAQINFRYLNILTFFNCIIIIYAFTSLQDYCNFTLILIILLPVVYILSNFTFQIIQQNIINWSPEVSQKNTASIDLYSRTVQGVCQNIGIQEYLFSEKGVSFEGIVIRHFESCVDSQCFCKGFQEQLNNNNSEKTVLRKQYIDLYLLTLFHQILSKSKIKQPNIIKFQYLALLIDSVRCPLKANIESIQLCQLKQSSMSFREKITINFLKKRAYFLFERDVLSIEKQKSQSTGGMYYSTDTDLYDIIKFDILLKSFQRITRDVYSQKRDFYNLIACEEVNLLQVKEKGEKILTQLDQIDHIIDELNQINPLSRRCQELTLIYTSIFDMRKKRINQQIVQQRKSIFHKLIRGDERTLNYFSSKSCCLFVSLLKPVGIIKRCTRTILNVYGYESNEVISRSINTLIPDSIAAIHDSILENFISEGQTKKISTTQYFFLGKSSQNFLFPINATIRLTHLDDEFGLSCFIEQIDTSNQYILIDDKLTMAGRRNKILNMSKDLYNTCFSNVFNQKRGDDKLGQIDLYKFIPFMQALDYQDCHELDYYQSIMIYPTSEYHVANMKKRVRVNPKNTSDLAWYMVFSLASGCGFLDVSFSVKRFKTKLGHSFKYIEVQSIRKVKRRLEKLESLHTLRSDLNQIMKLNVSLDDKVLKNSLGLLSQSIKMSFSNMDYSMLFKRDISTTFQSKKENNENQQWMLKKRQTIQSLSNKDTHYKSSGGGIEFEEELEQEDLEQDISKQPNLIDQSSFSNPNKSKIIQNWHHDRSAMNTFNETYHYPDDASHFQFKNKSMDLTQISFTSKLRNRNNSQTNLSNILSAPLKQQFKNDQSELNASQLMYRIDSEQNEIQINEPIQAMQSITQRDEDGRRDYSNFNLYANEEIHQEEGEQKNLKNFDSFQNNHPSNYDSFGDQNKRGNYQIKQLDEIPDTAKERYDQQSSRSQLPWGSATGRDLKGIGENDNEKLNLYQQQLYSTYRNQINNPLIEEEEEVNTFREMKKQIFYEPIEIQKKQRNEEDIEEGEYEFNNQNNNKVISYNSSKQNVDQIENQQTQMKQNFDRKSSQYLGFFSSSKSTGIVSSNQLSENGLNKTSPQNNNIDILKNQDSSSMIQSLPLISQQLNSQNRVSSNSFEVIAGQDGSQKNNFVFDFESPIPAICAQDSSRFEKSIKQQFFYQGTLSSLTTMKKSSNTRSTLQQKQNKKKKNKNNDVAQKQKNPKKQNKNNNKNVQKKIQGDNEKDDNNENEDKNLENEEQENNDQDIENEEYDDNDEDDEEDEDEEEEEELENQNQRNEDDNQSMKAQHNNNKKKQKNDNESYYSEKVSQIKNNDLELIDRIDTGMDRSSSTRTKSDMTVKKQMISTIMMNNLQGVLVKTIKGIGYMSFVFLLVTTIVVYFTISSNFKNMQDNSNVIYIGPGMEEDTSTIIIQNEFLRINKIDLLVNKPPQAKIDEIVKGNGEEFEVIRQRLVFLTDTKLEFANLIVDSDKMKVLETYDKDGQLMFQVKSTQYYSIFQAFLGFIQYNYIGDSISRFYIIRNFLEIANIFDDLRDSANNVAQDSADTTNLVLVYTFIMIVAVAFLTIMLIFPIYTKVQLSKEETLKLFATFSKEKLEEMIKQIERVINSNILIRDGSGKEVHLRNNLRWKKRTIALTTKLSRYNLVVSFACLAAFILISIYPIVNYSVNHSYIDQLSELLYQLSYIHRARGHSILAKSVLYMRISAAYDKDTSIANTIDNYLPTLYEKNSDTILQLKSMLSQFENTSKYNYDNQKKFVYGSLVNNMCEQLKEFKKLNLDYEKQREDYLSPTECLLQYDNILSHGMIIALEKVFDIYKDLFEITQKTDFIDKFKEWDKTHNFNLLDDLQEFQSGSFESIFLFQTRDLNDLFSFLLNLQLSLLIYALVVIFLLFLIGWIKFVKYVHSEISRTKYLFSLFSIDQLLENNYIASFIKKTSKNK